MINFIGVASFVLFLSFDSIESFQIDECGIVNKSEEGVTSNSSAFPWEVKILYRNHTDEPFHHRCSGVLLDRNNIITGENINNNFKVFVISIWFMNSCALSQK